MTASPQLRPPTGPGRLFAACLFLVVAGVLGMHGLASHTGAGGHGAAGQGHVVSQPLLMTGQATVTAIAPLLHPRMPVDGSSLAGLCLAVLPLLSLLLPALSLRRWHLPLPHSEHMRVRGTRGLGREPPSLLRLSVLRC